MTLSLPITPFARHFAGLIFVCLALNPILAQNKTQVQPSANSACRIEPADYKGWHAQQLSNRWVQLMVVPQNGGRLMQVTFAGHPYLFVNPQYAGQYLPPSQGKWFNYGGDKIWLLPEGTEDEQHWAGGSDVIDDSPFSFRKVTEGLQCEVELTGPSDPRTGVQFVRYIRLDSETPRIHFRTVMKNITGHPLEWSMQSVSQYDTGDRNSATPGSASRFNPDFHTFAPVNPASSYLKRYHVHYGPAENPSASVREDGLFTVHYAHLAAELWLDSTAGWLAVVDGSSRFGMVERFHYQESKPYPGKASIIFWTNGLGVKMSPEGIPSMSADDDSVPYYLEAELNSPLCRLAAGESCDFETEWFPTRAESEFHGVTDAGLVIRPLQATRQDDDKVAISGSFGVFFAGRLVARIYDEHGASLGSVPAGDASPNQPVSLETVIAPAGKAGRVSLHLEDTNGLDLGSLGEVRVGPTRNH
jgi:hypothetical protein